MARNLPTKGPNSYFKQYWAWLQLHHKGTFKSWNSFFKTKCFNRQMRALKQFDAFQEKAALKCDFAHPAMQMDDSLHLLYDILQAVTKFNSTIPQEHLNIVLQQTLRLAYPCPPETSDDQDFGEIQLRTHKNASRVAYCRLTGFHICD